jgi:hypothetical protein
MFQAHANNLACYHENLPQIDIKWLAMKMNPQCPAASLQTAAVDLVKNDELITSA